MRPDSVALGFERAAWRLWCGRCVVDASDFDALAGECGQRAKSNAHNPMGRKAEMEAEQWRAIKAAVLAVLRESG